jgi:hypothetical protein
MGEAPHLLDPEALEEGCPLQDGKQRGLYEVPAPGAGAGRSPASTAEFTDSIFEVLSGLSTTKQQIWSSSQG